jgi:hypothetical protein
VIKSALFVAFAGVVCLAAALEATAGPINIVSGSLVFPTGEFLQTGPLSLVGTRGFSVMGKVDLGENPFPPFNQCLPFCPSSDTLDLGGGRVSGSGFFDTNVTLEGRTFLDVGGLQSEAQLVLGFLGSVFVPEVGQSPIVLSTPFRLQDQESRFVPPGADSVPIRGRGVVTIGLEPVSGFWEVQNARYDFSPQPTPEPATLMLLASGLAGLAFRSRRQRGV